MLPVVVVVLALLFRIGVGYEAEGKLTLADPPLAWMARQGSVHISVSCEKPGIPNGKMGADEADEEGERVFKIEKSEAKPRGEQL